MTHHNDLDPKTGKSSPYRRHFARYYISTGLMVVLLCVNYFFWHYTKSQIYKISRASYNERVDRLTAEAQSLIEEYLAISDEGKSLFMLAPSLSRKQFTAYFQSILALREHRYNAISAVLFADYIAKPADYAASIRADHTVSPMGYPYFNITPEITTPATIVNYIVPYEEHTDLFGYNIMTDPAQQQYLAKSHVTRRAVATEKQLFLNAQRITIYQPIFEPEGTRDLKGYLILLIDPDVLFQSIADIGDHGITLHVYKGALDRIDQSSADNHYFGDVNSLYLSDPRLSGDYQSLRHIDIAGQKLTLAFNESEASQITFFQRTLLNGILYGGTVTIVLIFIAMNYLIFWNTEVESDAPGINARSL